MSTTTIQAHIAKLEIEANLILENANPEEILELSDLFLRLTGKKSIMEKVELHKQSLLDLEAQKVDFGQTFKIGLREFTKKEVYSLAKLDENLLAELIPDESNRSEFYTQKPKTQKEVEKLLKTFGVNAPIDQIYKKELKEGFKIVPKN